jgi:seipin
MISLSLLSPTYTPPPPSIAPPSPHQPPLSSTIPPSAILFTSRRPALIPYTSRLVSLPTRLLALPLYLLGLARESESLAIPMAESAAFARGRRNLPARILLELHAASELQVYDVRVRFTARFAGLRWLMYNHRVVAFVVFTTAFWVAEMIFAVLGWLALRAYLQKGAGDATVKEGGEDDLDSSDADLPSAFAGYGRARGRPATVKDEDSDESGLDEKAITEVAAELAEEDIKDEKSGLIGLVGGRTDSAIGTSFSEGSGGAGVSRRRSKGGHVVE